MNIQWQTIPANNYTVGRQGRSVNKIIIHWFGGGTLASADARFKNPASQVSAHYGISGSTIYQWVKESDTAYAAGNWEANLTSINIEHDATPDRPCSEETYQASAQLIAEIWRRHGIIPLRKHSEFKATQCPGTLDLARLDRMARDIISPPDPCATLRSELAQRDATIADLQGRLASASSQLDAANIAMNQKNAEIIALNERIASLPAEVIKEVPVIVEKVVEREVVKEVKVPAEELSALQHFKAAINKFLGR